MKHEPSSISNNPEKEIMSAKVDGTPFQIRETSTKILSRSTSFAEHQLSLSWMFIIWRCVYRSWHGRWELLTTYFLKHAVFGKMLAQIIFCNIEMQIAKIEPASSSNLV